MCILTIVFSLAAKELFICVCFLLLITLLSSHFGKCFACGYTVFMMLAYTS